jgi:hypothetical protein
MSKGKKEPSKIGNERRVGRKQILNAGTPKYVQEGQPIFTKGTETETETSETRQERNEGWRMPGAPVHIQNLARRILKRLSCDRYMWRGSKII